MCLFIPVSCMCECIQCKYIYVYIYYYFFLLKGLHEIDIFKPTHIGYHIDEVRNLISCLLRENRADYEDELRAQSIYNVVSAMKWALLHSTSVLVPYQYYEEFVRYEQGKLIPFVTVTCYRNVSLKIYFILFILFSPNNNNNDNNNKK